MKIAQMIRKWFPQGVDCVEIGRRLVKFYAENDAYHSMTASAGKETEPGSLTFISAKAMRVNLKNFICFFLTLRLSSTLFALKRS